MLETLLIIFGEFILFLLAALTALLVMTSRRKKRLHAALEKLADTVKSQKTARVESLQATLSDHFLLDEQNALELSEILYVAEKQFVAEFIEQQMQESLGGFYEKVCELLDGHLLTIPAPEPVAATPEPRPANDLDLQTMADAPVVSEQEQPPEWGDVFD